MQDHRRGRGQLADPGCGSPVTVSPSGPELTWPPEASISGTSVLASGVRTRTACPELRAMTSAVGASAMSRPRPITTR